MNMNFFCFDSIKKAPSLLPCDKCQQELQEQEDASKKTSKNSNDGGVGGGNIPAEGEEEEVTYITDSD